MSRALRSLAPFLTATLLVVPAGCGDDDPAKPANRPPIARAGADQTVRVGGTARLIGGGSDEDPGDTLTFAWSLVVRPPGSGAVVIDPRKATASFVADSVGQYVAQLTVSDGKSEDSDEAAIEAVAAK